MTIRQLLDQLHHELLLSYGHVNTDPSIHPETGRLVQDTTKESEWQREATVADAAILATRAAELAEDILKREN